MDQRRIIGADSAAVMTAVSYVFIYVALAVVFATVTLEALIVGIALVGSVGYLLNRFLGERSRVTVLGGFAFAVVSAVVATFLS